METLQITKDSALKAHREANDKGKRLLENLFGKKVFQGSVIDRVQTSEDACDELGIDIECLFDNAEDDYDRAETAIKTFAKALREGVHESECFYYPYFVRSSGGGFSYDDCGHDSTLVGARLRVQTAEKAKHLGKCMESYYNTMLTGK